MRHFLLCVVIFLIPFVRTYADWPTILNGNKRTGVTDEVLTFPLQQHWEYVPTCPPATVWPAPRAGYNAFKFSSNVNYDEAYPVTCAEGLALFASSGEQCLFAVDIASGQLQWTFPTGAPPRLAPTLWEGKALFGTDEGIVYCLDLKTGKEIWSFEAAPAKEMVMGQGRLISLWPVRSGVVVDGGVAYATAGLFSSEGVYLFALDAATGELKWRQLLQERNNDGMSPQGYPLVDEKSIYLTSRVRPARFSKVDGTAMPFRAELPFVKDAAYRFYDGGSYAQLWDGKLVYGQGAVLAVDADATYFDKYKKQRHGVLQFTWFNGRRIIFEGDLAYIAMDERIVAVDVAKIPELMKKELLAFENAHRSHRVPASTEARHRIELHGGPESERGKAILESQVKYALRENEKWPETSAKLFEDIAKHCHWMTPAKANEAMVLAGSHLIAGGEKQLVAIDTESGEIVWQLGTHSRVRTLAVSDGRLFVSTVDGQVRCYGHGNDHSVRNVREDAFPKEKVEPATWSGQQVPRKGHALVVGPYAVEVAEALAEQTEMHITILGLANEDEIRRKLLGSELYGHRINVPRQQVAPSSLPPYLFNLIFDTHAKPPAGLKSELMRLTRPHGGILQMAVKADSGDLDEWSAIPTDAGSQLVRGKRKGTANWTHNYATAGNTYCSEDQLSNGPFGILWFGEPGPQDRVDRHARSPMPLVIDGMTIMTGYDKLMGYDAFNGTKYWERWLPGVTRVHLPFGTSNLAVSKAGLFAVVNDRSCHVIDIRTGKTLREITPPVGDDPKKAFWGWIAADDERVYGSSSDYDERRRKPVEDRGHAVFAFDAASGKPAWKYIGEGIEHDGIAMHDGVVYLLDRKLSDEERLQALGSAPASTAPPRKRVDRRGNPLDPDLRKIVAIDAATGEVLWQKPFDLTLVTLDDRALTGATRGAGAFCMVSNGVLVVCGVGSIGHPYKEFTKGEFSRRSLYAFDTKTGKMLWGGARNYRKRPVIIGDYIFAEPSAWHLRTGAVKMELDPVTGKERPVNYLRGYSGCDHLVASAKALFGNASTGGMAHINIEDSNGYTPLSSLMFACGTGAVPANGIFIAPEGRSGCTCATQIHASLALYPRETGRAWSFAARGAGEVEMATVKKLAVNLGAPGQRRGDEGKLWIGYRGGGSAGGRYSSFFPRYKHNDSDFTYQASDLFQISGTRNPWIYSSAMQSRKELVFRLVPEGHSQAKYTLHLHFAEVDGAGPGERVFDVKVQDQVLVSGMDIAAEGGTRHALVRTFKNIPVSRDLEIALLPHEGSLPPSLAAFEVDREE